MLLVSVSLHSIGQTDRFRANAVKIIKVDNKKLSSDYTDCSLLIVIDYEKSRIFIFNNDDDVFDIIATGDVQYPQEGTKVVKIRCMDKAGRECNVYLWNINGDDYLNVEYSDFEYAYQIKKL